MSATQQRYTVNPKIILTELEDGTGVLLSLDSMTYFTLNATGVAVWRAIGQRPGSDVDALAGGLARAFEVEADDAARDVRSLLDELVRERLVRRE
jgi:hypothetical protein